MTGGPALAAPMAIALRAVVHRHRGGRGAVKALDRSMGEAFVIVDAKEGLLHEAAGSAAAKSFATSR